MYTKSDLTLTSEHPIQATLDLDLDPGQNNYSEFCPKQNLVTIESQALDA